MPETEGKLTGSLSLFAKQVVSKESVSSTVPSAKTINMIPELIQQWEENKEKLREYFKSHKQDLYSDYEEIVKLCFTIACPLFNPNDTYSSLDNFDIGKMTVIDNGDYQGTQLFIIPRETYQPCFSDYIITHNEYGSCSGCDILQAIAGYDYGLPTDSQVEDYMTLCLHIIQRAKRLIEEDI